MSSAPRGLAIVYRRRSRWGWYIRIRLSPRPVKTMILWGIGGTSGFNMLYAPSGSFCSVSINLNRLDHNRHRQHPHSLLLLVPFLQAFSGVLWSFLWLGVIVVNVCDRYMPMNHLAVWVPHPRCIGCTRYESCSTISAIHHLNKHIRSSCYFSPYACSWLDSSPWLRRLCGWIKFAMGPSITSWGILICTWLRLSSCWWYVRLISWISFWVELKSFVSLDSRGPSWYDLSTLCREPKLVIDHNSLGLSFRPTRVQDPLWSVLRLNGIPLGTLLVLVL